MDNSEKFIQRKIREIIGTIAQPTIAIFLALLVGAIAILLTGNSPLLIYRAMLKGAFGGKYYLLATLTRATPILICGLGAAIAWASNYMGIGGEGQMIVGGFVSAIVGLYAPGPVWVRWILAFTAAVAAGGVYSALSAWLLDQFKMSLAISTLMMNYIAQYVMLHYTQNVFLDRSTDGKMVQTEMLPKEMRFPLLIQNYNLHFGFILGILLVFAIWFLMYRTSFGFESRMSGFNIRFCEYGGVNGKKIMYRTLLLSGMICGFAGMVEVFGVQYRYVNGIYVSASYAWVGLNAALISGYNPIGILFTSIILSGIQTGGSLIARSTNVPIEISAIIQGCITLFISARIILKFRLPHRLKHLGRSRPKHGEETLPNSEGASA